MYVAARPSRRNYLITIWCGCQRQRRHLCESLREWLLVTPFTRAFLKSPSSRGLSAIAELLVTIFGVLNPEEIWHQQLVHLPASPVYCSHFTLWNPKKSFSTVLVLFILTHTLQIIYVITEENKLAVKAQHGVKNMQYATVSTSLYRIVSIAWVCIGLH